MISRLERSVLDYLVASLDDWSHIDDVAMRRSAQRMVDKKLVDVSYRPTGCVFRLTSQGLETFQLLEVAASNAKRYDAQASV